MASPCRPALVLLQQYAAYHRDKRNIATHMVGVPLIVFAVCVMLTRAQWLGWGLGFFVVGWLIPLVGHHDEGRRPALVDDVVGLLVGPMFVVLQTGAAVGGFKDLTTQVEAHAGPVIVRNISHPVAH